MKEKSKSQIPNTQNRMLEAIQARQRRKPVRCWFSGKKVLVWDQEVRA